MPGNEPAGAGRRNLLTRDNLTASLAMAGGLSGGALAAFAVMVGTPENYGHSGFFDGLARMVLAGAVMFAMGAYLGAALPWAIDRREQDHVPALVALGAMVGMGVGSALMGLLAWVTVVGGTLPLMLVAGWVGARLACRVQRPTPSPAWRRWVRLPVAAAVAVGLALSIGTPGASFPGAEAPMAERRAWAVSTFGEAYAQAETYMKRSAAVRDHLGTVQGVAPTEGVNRTTYSPGELMGEFTLEVRGDKGAGVAHVRFMHGSSSQTVESYGFEGELKTPTATVVLPPLPGAAP